MSAKPFGQLREQLEESPSGAQALERARKNLDAEIAAYEAGLAELRRAHNLTQAQLARQLGVTQGEVSRLERRADLYLSTLQSYIEAMGGQLELVGVFDDARVKLAIGELVPAAPEDAEDDTATTPVACPWEAAATLEFSGDLSDKLMDAVRHEILSNTWVISDAVGIRRGRYSDLVDVSFELEAMNADEARRRLDAAVNRVIRKTGVRPSGSRSVEPASNVDL
jgi:transcriptional regulator with XRE-family HTH domain